MCKASSTLQYSTLQKLLAPANLKDKSLADIVVALMGHFKPKPVEFYKKIPLSVAKPSGQWVYWHLAM